MRHQAWISFGAILVGLTGIGVTLVATVLLGNNSLHARKLKVVREAHDIRVALLFQIDRERSILYAARGLYAASNAVTPKEWNTFGGILDSGRSGSAVLMHLASVPSVDVASFLRKEEKFGERLSVHPPVKRKFGCVVDRVWPHIWAGAMLGFNACTGTLGQHVLLRARRDHRIAVSRKIEIQSRHDPAPGLLFALSLQRRSGWVAEIVPLSLLFHQLPLDRYPGGYLRIFDQNPRTRHQMLYESGHPARPPSYWKRIFHFSDLTRVSLNVPVADHLWQLNYSQRIDTGLLPSVVLAGGLLLSLTMVLLLLNFSRTRGRAVALAESMTKDLRESQELLASITDNIRDGIYRGTPREGLIYVNRTLARMFGFASEDDMMVHQGAIRYAQPERRDMLRDKLLVSDGHYEDEEIEYVRADGTHFTGVNSARVVRDEQGEITHYDGVITDITERKEAERQIEFMAHYDRLTGLPNRTLLEDRFSQAVAQAERGKRSLALLFIDLDNFKDINDLHGHDIGDLFLIEVAARLKHCVREGDTVARLGGDEFIVLLSNVKAVEGVTRVANAMLESVAESYLVAGLELHTTPSIGISLYPEDGKDLSTLSQHADAAMYQVKHTGRAGIAFFTRKLNEQAHRQVAMENALRHAIERYELSVHYQPRIDLRTGQITGAEALLRWTHPEWGSVPPVQFIPAAERTGLIVDVGDWVLEMACRQWRQWEEHTGKTLKLGINVSARQLRKRDFHKTVKNIVEMTNMVPQDIELELTESILVERAKDSEEILLELHDLGVRLALDDFGTGYSGMGYLKRFNIDIIKIDQSFVRDILSDPNDAAIVRAVIAIARDLDLRVVAEGVESEEQIIYLKHMGCDEVQGFYIAKPMPAFQFLGFLERYSESGFPAIATASANCKDSA